jgi:hypothetical protein
MMEDTIVAHLKAALLNPLLWVRLGAAESMVGESAIERATLLAHGETVRRGLATGSKTPSDSAIELMALARCLEWSEIDSATLLVAAFGDSMQRILSLMESDHDEFVTYLNDKTSEIPAGLPYQARKLLVDLRRFRLWRERKAKQPPMPEEGASMTRFDTAAAKLLRHRFGWASEEELKATFSDAAQQLRSDIAADRRAAIHAVARIAFTDTRWYVHEQAADILCDLGTDSSYLLLSALRGKSSLTLSDVEFEQFSQAADSGEEADGGRRGKGGSAKAVLKENAPVFLASEILRNFTDADTASMLAELVVFGSAVEAERAKYVLLRMKIDVCVPALLWEVVNAPLLEQRERAYAVLAEVIDGQARGQHQLRRVGDFFSLDPSTSLAWILRLAKSCQALPDWATDPESAGSLSWCRSRPATRLLIANALRLVPLVEGESRSDISYSTPSLWDRLISFSRGAGVASPDRKRPVAVLPRRPVVKLPSRCLLQSRVRLSVGLEIAAKATDPGAFGVPIAQGEDQADLLVVVTSSGFSVEPGHALLRVPRGQASDTITFDLIATRVGSQLVEISFFRGTERVGYCTADTEVIQGTMLNRAVAGMAKIFPGEATSWVGFNASADGFLEYTWLDPESGPEPQFIGRSPQNISLSQVTAWITQQNDLIRGILAEKYSGNDLQGSIMSLGALGHGLYRQLAPLELTPILDALPRGSTVAVESDSHWVPWELLATHAAGPLLGEHFQLIRIPRKPALAGDGPNDTVPLDSTVDTGITVQNVLAVTGDSILLHGQKVDDLTGEIFGSAAPMVRDLLEGTLPELESAVVDADLIHFTCHGRASPYHLSIGEGAAKRFYVPQVQTLNLKPGVVVFVNACSSAQSSLMLADMENMGFEFYLRGARPFLGALGPIPKADAQCMAQLFYKAFIEESLPAGDALAKAKREAAKILRRPTWMFYCLVGPASARRLPPML